MKMLNRKNASLVVMTALLSMPLTQVIANEIGKSPDASDSQAQVLPNDSTINNEVKSAFLNHEDFSDKNINVETNKGQVSLSGEISTEAQRNMAINKAKAVKGVKHVNADGLKINK